MNTRHCEDCGCIMDGGFCTNCHEEVFIAVQYTDLHQDVPVSINNKASEHINNKTRQKRAKKIRKEESNQRTLERKEYFGE